MYVPAPSEGSRPVRRRNLQHIYVQYEILQILKMLEASGEWVPFEGKVSNYT